jgi:predicted alpha-1,2-mannosidase
MNTKQRLLIAFFCLYLQGIAAFGQVYPYAKAVNTRIGWQGKGANAQERYLEAGYTFPGAMYPFGMVQFTPTFFEPDKGFVINQMSGAGCEHMGNLPLLPMPGTLKQSPNDMKNYKPGFQIKDAYAGFFKAVDKNNISSSLTVAKRSAIGKFDFPSSLTAGTIIIGTGLNATTMHKAHVSITNKSGFEGYADGGSFCGSPVSYRIYFAAQFDNTAAAWGTWAGDSLHKNNLTEDKPGTGVYFTFNTLKSRSIKYKVGISYVSLANARQNLKADIPGWNFDQIKNNTVKAWNTQLSKIEVHGGTADHTTQFYTHLYHALTHPNIFNDVNGQYIGGDNKMHTAKGFDYYTAFSNWDTYRTQTQLISMLAPKKTSDIVKSILLFAEQSGGSFPRWVLNSTETGIMQGDPTAALVSVAYAFGARDFDTKKALEMMRRGAEMPGSKSQQVETRPFLKQYLDKGYIKASMQLEYTTADFAIGQFALQALNNHQLYETYLRRAESWKNLYNPETTWLTSRNDDGSWKNQDEDWREASYKNYFWMVPYSLKALIDTIGGKHVAEKRLDDFFNRLDGSYSQEWFAAGNEPDFQVPWVYNWVGAPYKTQLIVRRIISEQYHNRDNGLPGNDDLGAMGAWYVFANMGLYPMIPGVGGFSINGPSFSTVKIHLSRGVIELQGGSSTLPYIQALQVNGKASNSTWISLNELQNGAKLLFKLSDKPNKSWGTAVPPPSF